MSAFYNHNVYFKIVTTGRREQFRQNPKTIYNKDAFEKFKSLGILAQNDTRWNSTLRQINAELHKGFTELNSISNAQKTPEVIFIHRDRAQLKELALLLEPFAEHTEELSADNSRYCLNLLQNTQMNF